MIPKTGDSWSYQKSFTQADVNQFGQLSGDQGRHHVIPDSQGRLMVQGLLTATLGTKLGGDLNYIAAEMTNRFLAPVYTGDRLTCTLTLDEVIEKERHFKVNLHVQTVNQEKTVVLVGNSHGIIRK